jgi:hypothetical protein
MMLNRSSPPPPMAQSSRAPSTMTAQSKFLRFLRQDLAIPGPSLRLALEQTESLSYLPMVLWQYGLITLPQLDRIFDWLEQHEPLSLTSDF